MNAIFLFHRKQRGLTLIEVLIAVVVLSIGLLGLAGLQVTGLRNNHSAYLRSQATVLANDIADRMRANRSGFLLDAYDGTVAAENSACVNPPGCTADAMAAHDLWEWQRALSGQLPDGQGVVCVDSTPADGDDASDPTCDGGGEFYAIKVWWRDDHSEQLQRFVTSLSQ